MRKVAKAGIIRPEFGRNQSVTAEAVIHVDFSSGSGRGIISGEIVAISGSSAKRFEIVHQNQETPSNILEFPRVIKPEISPIEEVKKESGYRPDKEMRELHKKDRRRFRTRRGSRCRAAGKHEYKKCGSSFCRVQEGVKRQRRESQQPTAIASARSRRNRRNLQEAA